MVPERLRHLVDETSELAARFTAAGKRLYLVGGVVRDAVLGRLTPGGDLDFTTDALPDETERIVSGWADAVWTQGKRFGTIGVLAGGRRMEITTHRAEAYASDSRKPEVEFAHAIEADLSRRDFTVNAMALSLP
ncbi:MAG TPA: CCA tRNA nucleotidyltransferase, partial [Acidimicrobiales bacterium]|nr:CCA tRNA nucleotidyltransferase [Acidimicrobiales bacterium]